MTAPPFGEEEDEAQAEEDLGASAGPAPTEIDGNATAFLTEALTGERPLTDGTDVTARPLDATNVALASLASSNDLAPLDLTELPVGEAVLDATHKAEDAPRKDGEYTARQKGLVHDAHVSEEHLAVARDTMLDLAKSIEDSARRRRLLEDMLEEEKKISAQLRLEKIPLQRAIEEGLSREARLEQKRMDELMKRDELLWFSATWWAQHALAPLSIMHEDAPLAGPRGMETLGDLYAVKEILHLWKSCCTGIEEEVVVEREIDTRDAEWEAKLRALEAEWKKKVEVEKEKTVRVQEALDALRPEIAKLEAALLASRAESQKYKRQIEDMEVAHKAEIEALLQQLAEVRKLLADKDRQIADLQQIIAEADEKYRLLQEKHAAELAGLRDQLRRMGQQMDEQVVTLKTTREVATRSKREGGAGISPERFAQLVAELEELRDKLAALGRDSEYDRERSAWLTAKLEQNKRRLELERQFLPLLHKVRGPVGPKNPELKNKKAADQFGITLGPPPVPPENRRISHSQSASSIDAPRRSATAGRMASSGGFGKGFAPS
eukprot:TRINITY_DN104659_c0_g1_i1.p1 TRINITY_DN104659_c0_g1~~TRINITY_DN104659_c0_g1_i1.p1  ORF type:complete len:552 (+),score=144.75 TRINITY_DN104659_c0_g1_i1:51-1706(+)